VIEQTLVEQWGAPPAGRYVAASLGGQVYLADGVFDRLTASTPAMQAVERALLAVPGLERVVRRDRLDGADAVSQAIARGYRADRSGDLFLIPRRDWILETRADNDATTHGTMYEYDRQVPLLFLGAGVQPGKRTEAVSPLDIAPTLARAAGIQFVNREGRPLLGNQGTR